MKMPKSNAGDRRDRSSVEGSPDVGIKVESVGGPVESVSSDDTRRFLPRVYLQVKINALEEKRYLGCLGTGFSARLAGDLTVNRNGDL